MKRLTIVKLGVTRLTALRRTRGDYEDWIRAGLGLPDSRVETWNALTEPSPPPVEKLAGVVLTGSPAMVTDRADWSQRVEGWLPGVLRAGIPLLGICYGHQLLASAMGGVVADNASGVEVGTVGIRLLPERRSDSLFSTFPETMTVQSSHRQSVLEAPDCARRLGGNAHDPNHILAYGAAAWGVQFHPEFDEEIIRGCITIASDRVRAAGKDPQALLKDAAPAPHCAAVLPRFGRLVARREGWTVPATGSAESQERR